MRRLMIIPILLFLASCSQSPALDNTEVAQPASDGATDPAKTWVTADRLARHTCPSETCGIVGQFFFREAATVLERRGEWARVSKRYDAYCVGGKSKYIDKGNANCTAANGITGGQFSEWVLAKNLSETRPRDPALTAAQDEKLVADSDDFSRYRTVFKTAARKLIDDGQCTEADFTEMGAWVKSANNPDEPIYFMYCGGMTVDSRIYLDASTGRTFR